MLNALSNTIDLDFQEETDLRQTGPMLTDWNDAKTAAFQKEIIGFGHNLSATGLFTDAALISLLERHPTEKMDVCTMGEATHPLYPNKFRTCLLYTSPSPRDQRGSRMPSSA